MHSINNRSVALEKKQPDSSRLYGFWFLVFGFRFSVLGFGFGFSGGRFLLRPLSSTEVVLVLVSNMSSSTFILLVCSVALLCSGSVRAKSIYETFYENFDSKCLTRHAGFIQQFYRNQYNNTNDQYLVFTFHDHGLRNGGIGDRMGGLISATAMSIALNRTLVIRADNGFNDLFQPLHPNPDTQKSVVWQDAGAWSGFDEAEYLDARSGKLPLCSILCCLYVCPFLFFYQHAY